MITIYHNPSCSKSRQTLDLIRAQGLECHVVEYLKNPPSADQLDEILTKLNLEPQDIVRTKEEAYETLGLKNKSLSRSELIQILVKNPILIERPIVVCGDKAALGRPPEKVLEILK